MSLSIAQERAAVFLSEGMTQAETSRRIGKTTQTVYRWTKMSDFQERVTELRTNATHEAMELLRGNVNNAVGVIVKIAKEGAVIEEESSTRLQFNAAKWVAERVLAPAVADERPSGGKRARETAVELERLTNDDRQEMLDRGTVPQPELDGEAIDDYNGNGHDNSQYGKHSDS